MKKLAQLIKNHLDGNKTKASIEIMSKISSKLQESGLKPPFKVVKVSQSEYAEQLTGAFTGLSGAIKNSYEMKIQEYVERIKNGEDKASIMQGLPSNMAQDLENALANEGISGGQNQQSNSNQISISNIENKLLQLGDIDLLTFLYESKNSKNSEAMYYLNEIVNGKNDLIKPFKEKYIWGPKKANR